MSHAKNKNFGEINLKVLFNKIWDRKLYFAISIILCGALAYLYTKIATPMYEVSTSIMIDPSGKNRQLGDSKYVDGGVGLIDSEKNLYNEIAILKSYTLIEQAIRGLDFGVSYFSGSDWAKREQYGYFPFEVVPAKGKTQLHGALFQLEFLGKDKFKLSIDAPEYVIFDPSNKTSREVREPISFSKTYSIGEVIEHELFNFTIKNPADNVAASDFADQHLYFQVNDLAGVANDYYERLKVEQVDIQASILTLNITGSSPEKEIQFLKALSNAFINRELLERDEIAAGKEKFIRTQLENISDSLALAEKTLENFKRGASAVDLTRSASNALDQLQKLETDKGQAALNIKYYQSLLDYINDADAIDKIVAPSVAGINDPLLSDNLLELKRLYNEKTRLEFYKGSKSYDLVLLNEQISTTTNALKQNVANLIETEQLKLNDKNQRIARLESTISQLPANEKQLVNFERENTLYGNLYNYLNQELAKTGIARAENISDTKVIDKPRQLGDGPVAPQKILIMLLAMIVGCFIPMVGIIFSNQAREFLQNSQQLEQYSAIPLLGEVETFNNSLSTLANYKSDWEKEETFRSLAASLQFLVSDPEKNVIAFSSYFPGEGKTFCALNLAANYAKAGKKTLLVDLNFRNPVIAKGLDTNEAIDLKSFILDTKITADHITQEHSSIPNLHFIITKSAESNPHRFLTSNRLQTLLAALKYEYDYIIIDTPAVGAVSDYLLVSHHTDINIFISRKGKIRLEQLDDLEELIEKGEISHPFIVFNGATKRKSAPGSYTQTEKSVKEKKLSKWPSSFKKSVS